MSAVQHARGTQQRLRWRPPLAAGPAAVLPHTGIVNQTFLQTLQHFILAGSYSFLRRNAKALLFLHATAMGL